jgi:nucleotide-binding universal stress UspA family protein
MSATDAPGLVIFAYDGSELAKLAIREASDLLRKPCDALVVTVWQPWDVGFVPPAGASIDAKQVTEVKRAAEETAAEGAALAEAAGFRPQSLARESAPTWKGLVQLADEREARLIVLGSHGRSGLASVLVGSVAAAVAEHSRRSVLIVHRRS